MQSDPDFGLPEGLTMMVTVAGKEIFTSSKRWLHPLFDLEDIVIPDRPGVLIEDRVTGRAAALLLARLGIPNLWLRTGVLSQRAMPILHESGIVYRCFDLVERIACSTEDRLRTVRDPEVAYELLSALRKKPS
jgi:hypothetical protein